MACSLSTTSAIASSCGIGPKGSPRKSVSVPARITRCPRREDRHQLGNRRIEKLRFVDRDDLGIRLQLAKNLFRRIDRDCLGGPSIVARHQIDPRIPLVEMGLEYLYASFGRSSRGARGG